MHAATAVLHREPVELWFYPVLDCCFGGVWWDFIFFFHHIIFEFFSRTILPHVFSFCYVFSSFTLKCFLRFPRHLFLLVMSEKYRIYQKPEFPQKEKYVLSFSLHINSF